MRHKEQLPPVEPLPARTATRRESMRLAAGLALSVVAMALPWPMMWVGIDVLQIPATPWLLLTLAASLALWGLADLASRS